LATEPKPEPQADVDAQPVATAIRFVKLGPKPERFV
jgi:hypothetical protein